MVGKWGPNHLNIQEYKIQCSSHIFQYNLMCVGNSTLQNLRSKDMKINFLEDRGIPRKHKHELADIRKQDNTLDEQK